jgi:hypothetical protein
VTCFTALCWPSPGKTKQSREKKKSSIKTVDVPKGHRYNISVFWIVTTTLSVHQKVNIHTGLLLTSSYSAVIIPNVLGLYHCSLSVHWFISYQGLTAYNRTDIFVQRFPALVRWGDTKLNSVSWVLYYILYRPSDLWGDTRRLNLLPGFRSFHFVNMMDRIDISSKLLQNIYMNLKNPLRINLDLSVRPRTKLLWSASLI